MGHFNNGARVLSLLYNKVNFSLTQRILQQIQHLDFLHERLLWLSGICGCADMWAHQQVNVATSFGVIHARTKKPHRCALAECSGCGLANGLNLVGVETHAIIVCSAGDDWLSRKVEPFRSQWNAQFCKTCKSICSIEIKRFPSRHPSTSYFFDSITRNVTRLSQNTISH